MMAGTSETRARVLWDLLQATKGKERVEPSDAPLVAQTMATTLKNIEEERRPELPVLLVVDGLNLFLRNWCANPKMDQMGEHIGGVVGTLTSLAALTRRFSPHDVLVCWDGEGGSRRRRGVFAEYKAGRKPRVNRFIKEGTAERGEQNLQDQYRKTRRACELLGLRQVEVRDVEADDAIALVTGHLTPDWHKVVVSTDRDMLQLVSDRASVWSPVKKVLYTPAEMLSLEGCLPENFIYVKALAGDGSDNLKVEALHGLGQKTVLKLFPVLAERPVELKDIMETCAEPSKNRSAQAWRERILACRDELYRNVELMQLRTPFISAHSVGVVREQFRRDVHPFMTELRLVLGRDDTAPDDAQFFSTFESMHVRRRKREE